ncbi:Nn.00g022860.m01.CDS01 [Neocucurbitaria sp. VM-36]
MAICLATLVVAGSTHAVGLELVPYNVTIDTNVPTFGDTTGYDPSHDYHGYAVVEVWIGRSPVNVGNVYGPDLYNVVHRIPEQECGHSDVGGKCVQNDWNRVSLTPVIRIAATTLLQISHTGMKVEAGAWANSQIRNLMIGIVAGTLEATTNNPDNCYHFARIKLCNVGDIVRVNLADHSGYKNYLQVRLYGEPHGFAEKGIHKCCEWRFLVDSAIDGLGMPGPNGYFPANSVIRQGGGVLFVKRELELIGNNCPHMTFESYQSYKEKTDQNPSKTTICKSAPRWRLPLALRPKQYIPKPTEEVHNCWNFLDFHFGQSPSYDIAGNHLTGCLDYDAVAKIGFALDELSRSPVGVSKFFLLGMGSVHDIRSGSVATKQYFISFLVIKDYLRRLIRPGTAATRFNPDIVVDATLMRRYNPEIVIDTTYCSTSDIEFLEEKFGTLTDCTMSYAPLSHILTIVDSPHAFIITFTGDNPVRQMIADIVYNNPLSPPPAIICTPWYLDNDPKDEALYGTDRNSDRVVAWLKDYKATKFTEIWPRGHSPFQETWLFVHKDFAHKTAEDLQVSFPIGNVRLPCDQDHYRGQLFQDTE